MSATPTLLIRNVDVEGRAVDVLLDEGSVADIGPRLPRAREEFDGRGGSLIPGLVDHHIHLMALASKTESVALDEVATFGAFASLIKSATEARPKGSWIRAVGYHEVIAGELTRHELDMLAPHHPVRIQHQSGALWILNSLALSAVKDDDADCIERDVKGQPTGRLWRGDAWLKRQISQEPPSLAPIGRQLARFGITGVTDASVTNDRAAANLFSANVRDGTLPQRLTLMTACALEDISEQPYSIGPVKILLDDQDMPALDDLIARIGQARSWKRAVAIHCVTAMQLALALAAFGTAGALRGDRIEHGGIIPREAIAELRKLELTVVTQPGFVYARGDRYLSEVDVHEQPDLYRCESLITAHVSVAASSDAPYGPVDPWLAIRTAVSRQTRAGRVLGAAERVPLTAALRLYLTQAELPGISPLKVAKGVPADLCLLKVPLEQVLDVRSAELVQATFVGGHPIYQAT